VNQHQRGVVGGDRDDQEVADATFVVTVHNPPPPGVVVVAGEKPALAGAAFDSGGGKERLFGVFVRILEDEDRKLTVADFFGGQCYLGVMTKVLGPAFFRLSFSFGKFLFLGGEELIASGSRFRRAD